MAKECRGVLLIIEAVLRSTLGRKLLFKRKKFGGQTGLSDWTLVELLLEWEAYLCESKMSRKLVMRLGKKHRFIMYIMRIVAVRTTGMGLKIFKFHAITHLVEDIILYGVPAEVDTGSNESHHKPSKHVRIICNELTALDAFSQPNSPFCSICVPNRQPSLPKGRKPPSITKLPYAYPSSVCWIMPWLRWLRVEGYGNTLLE